MTMLSIQGLTFRYSKQQPLVIDGLTLTVHKGEIVGICGPSGSGKSSLLRLIAGLEVPERGDIMINGQVMTDQRKHVDIDKRGVGMVFQDYALFPHLNVARNVAFGLSKLKRNERKQQVEAMLELVQLSKFAKRYPHELSGGQQQRVALARALAAGPAILLMDEPFSNLDTELKTEIRCELREILNKTGMTCLFVSHDQTDVDQICDRTIQMKLPQ